MKKIDMGWVTEQLRGAGYDTSDPSRQSTANSVILLLRELDQQRHTGDQRQTVVDLFHKLASGHAIAPRNVQDVGARWAPFRLGDYPVGATVRVKLDAYTGELGSKHNGMVGRFVGARGGLVSVQYAESTEGTGHKHTPDKVEVLEKKS